MKDNTPGSNPREETEKQRLSGLLVEHMSSWTEGRNALETAIPGLRFSRWEHPTEPTSYTMGVNVCLIAQGVKRVMLGEDAYVYDANHYLVTSVDLPVVAQIIEASHEMPYLGLILGIDQQALAQLMVDSNLPIQEPRRTDRGIGVSELSLSVLKTVVRLVELLDTPGDIPILAPLISKELFYYLLIGPQGARLRQIVMAGAHGHKITQAIGWLKTSFRQPYSMDELEDRVNMSRSAFYQHFRAITSLSPLQYRQHLRLQEARRLMVVGQLDATTAAFEVGYESPTQFNREYRRLFGKPPAMDAASLREAVSVNDKTAVLTG